MLPTAVPTSTVTIAASATTIAATAVATAAATTIAAATIAAAAAGMWLDVGCTDDALLPQPQP